MSKTARCLPLVRAISTFVLSPAGFLLLLFFTVVSSLNGYAVPGYCNPGIFLIRDATTNSSPHPTHEMDTIYINESFSQLSVGLDTMYADVDGDTLRYAATTPDSSQISADVVGNLLELEVFYSGGFEVFLQISDGKGGEFRDTIRIQVAGIPIPSFGTWTWMGGSDSTNFRIGGTYGEKGVAGALNVPGSRDQLVSWTEEDGSLWLFGGWGYDVNGNWGSLNDMWKWDGADWTWIGGDSVRNPTGSYVSQGAADPRNYPSGRAGAAFWVDENGSLWLFGGSGYNESGSIVRLNDFWKWDGLNWTWISGDNSGEQPASYGTLGVPASSNHPGARSWSTSWIDGDELWLFGGYRIGLEPQGVHLNDLWRWDGNNWTWISGSETGNVVGVYGGLGIADSNNVPGARYGATSWTDNEGNKWLFGGTGYDSMSRGRGSDSSMNDLWQWDGAHWVWMGGSPTKDHPGVYGIKGVEDGSSFPGSRTGASSWVDAQGLTWLFGGWRYGENSNISGPVNDLWKWDGENWTWVLGDFQDDLPGNFGNIRVASEENFPGGKSNPATWIDDHGDIWIFSGAGPAAEGKGAIPNDLWKLTTPPAFEGGSPAVSNVTETHLTLSLDLNKAGSVFYLIAEKGDVFPAIHDVMSGEGDPEINIVYADTVQLIEPGFTAEVLIEDLSPKTAYSIFILSQDTTAQRNLMVSPIQVDATTLPHNAAPTDIILTNQSMEENLASGELVGQLSAEDPDEHMTPHVFSFVNGDGSNDRDNDLFLIEGDRLLSAQSYDHEAQPEFHIFIKATDECDSSFRKSFVISVNDVNEGPVIADTTFVLDENTESGSTVGQVLAYDPDSDSLTFYIEDGNDLNAFRLDSLTGVLVVDQSVPLDFEANPSFSILVECSDGEITDRNTVLIDLANINEAPTVQDTTFSIIENSTRGTIIGSILAVDQEQDSLYYTISSGNVSGVFDLDPLTGVLSIMDSSQFDFEVRNSFVLVFEVSDGVLSSQDSLYVEVINANEPPVILDMTFDVEENSENGALIGFVTATDAEGDELSFAVTRGDDGRAFALEQASGQLSVGDSSMLDFEVKSSFSLTVTADDGEFVSSASIVVNVLDIQETLLGLQDGYLTRIYPVPASSFLNISADILRDVDDFKVVDSFGRTHHLLGNPRDGLDISTLSNGVYFLKLKIGSNTELFRFIKK